MNTDSLQKPTKIILGIDPGTIIMGYGVVKVCGNEIRLIEMNVLKLSPKLDNHKRLERIYHKVSELIETFSPNCFAIEAPFFGKNVQSMLKLGRAQGVAIAAAMGAGLEVCEYSPRKVKQSITGNGNAAKEQVWKMLQSILLIRQEAAPNFFDASDALAVAVCHHFQDSPVSATPKEKKLNGWKDFLLSNPERIKKQ